MAPSNLNDLEKLLKHITELNGLVKHTFTRDLSAATPENNPNDVHAGLLADLASQANHMPRDLKVILEKIKSKFHDNLIDDRKYVIEDYVKIASDFPSDSKLGPIVTEAFVKTLWGRLRHPPLSYLGRECRDGVTESTIDKQNILEKHAAEPVWGYRSADGSNNNRLYPHLGQGGSPYARTVSPKKELAAELPDTGLLFDEIFARGEETREHPNKLSSMLFYLATIIIHDVFRTNDRNYNVVDSSSYLDLGPLYGHCQADQKKVRLFKKGKLKPDVFSEIRLLGFPPGVSAFLICFNRFHNYIAGELLTINEGGRFTSGHGKDAERNQDEDLFQTARLITCGLYINIILIDYVRTILNLNRTNSDWNLDPRIDMKGPGPGKVAEGVGNQVSVEFNLLYRWHSTISKRDEKWSNNMFKSVLEGQDPSTLRPEELAQVFRRFLGKQPDDPAQWKFDGMTRDPETGLINDQELVDCLTASTEDVAGAFGSRNVPICMKAIEMLGMQQARNWNVATLNEFRMYFGLMPHKTFKDITTDDQVAKSLEALYNSPDMVELYPGLIAEDAKKPVVPGSGLCAGFTTATAILADAVALVRGDRFYTIDFNAATLTNWGYSQISSKPRVAGGGMMYKLLMNALPGWYRGTSVYAMFPFTVPEEQREILRNLGQEDDYDFSTPHHAPEPISISSYDAITKILDDQTRYKVPWGPNTAYITHHDYMLSGDSPANAEQKQFISDALSCPGAHGTEELKKLYIDTTTELFFSRSKKMRSGHFVDAVNDVGNIAHAMVAAKVFHIPLKTEEHRVGFCTASDFYTIYSTLFAWVFLDLDPSNEFILRYYAKQASKPLILVTKAIVELVQQDQFPRLMKWLGLRHKEDICSGYGTKLIQRLSKGGKSAEEVTASIIPTMSGMVGTQAQGFAQMLDVLLSEPHRSRHWHHIEQLARSEDPHDFNTLRKYALEAFRLAPPAFGTLRNVEAESVTIQDGNKTTKAHAGDRIYTNFVEAGLDENVFPNPLQIDLTRDPSLYINHGYGPHMCIGKHITNTAMAAQLKVCGQLKNLRRAPNPRSPNGMWYKPVNNSVRLYMKPDGSDYWPFPTTLKVMFDGFSAEMAHTQPRVRDPSSLDSDRRWTYLVVLSLLGSFALLFWRKVFVALPFV